MYRHSGRSSFRTIDYDSQSQQGEEDEDNNEGGQSQADLGSGGEDETSREDEMSELADQDQEDPTEEEEEEEEDIEEYRPGKQLGVVSSSLRKKANTKRGSGRNFHEVVGGGGIGIQQTKGSSSSRQYHRKRSLPKISMTTMSSSSAHPAMSITQSHRMASSALGQGQTHGSGYHLQQQPYPSVFSTPTTTTHPITMTTPTSKNPPPNLSGQLTLSGGPKYHHGQAGGGRAPSSSPVTTPTRTKTIGNPNASQPISIGHYSSSIGNNVQIPAATTTTYPGALSSSSMMLGTGHNQNLGGPAVALTPAPMSSSFGYLPPPGSAPMSTSMGISPSFSMATFGNGNNDNGGGVGVSYTSSNSINSNSISNNNTTYSSHPTFNYPQSNSLPNPIYTHNHHQPHQPQAQQLSGYSIISSNGQIQPVQFMSGSYQGSVGMGQQSGQGQGQGGGGAGAGAGGRGGRGEGYIQLAPIQTSG